MPVPLIMQADLQHFRDACAQFATGVAIVTLKSHDGDLHGLTVSSFTSVSLRPPMVLVCIDYGAATLPQFRANPHFGISLLSDAQRELSVTFSVKPEGRFEGVDWFPGDNGSPLLHGALAHLECQVAQIVEAGDHAILIGAVTAAAASGGEPLLYFNRAYRTLK